MAPQPVPPDPEDSANWLFWWLVLALIAVVVLLICLLCLCYLLRCRVSLWWECGALACTNIEDEDPPNGRNPKKGKESTNNDYATLHFA